MWFPHSDISDISCTTSLDPDEIQSSQERELYDCRFRIFRVDDMAMTIHDMPWRFNESRMKITDEAFSDVGPPASESSESFVWQKVFSKLDVFKVLLCSVLSCLHISHVVFIDVCWGCWDWDWVKFRTTLAVYWCELKPFEALRYLAKACSGVCKSWYK